MFNVSTKSIKPCNKIMRISDHFYLQFFSTRLFFYVVFSSGIRGAFQDCHKTSEIELSQKLTTDVACFHYECLGSALNPPLNFSKR